MRTRIALIAACPLVMLAACGSNESVGEEVSQAADRTAAAGGARFKTRVTFPITKRQVNRFKSAGVMDERGFTDEVQTALSASGRPGSSPRRRAIVFEDATYFRFPGETWIAILHEEDEGEFYWADLFVTVSDLGPLARLADALPVERIGSERVRGIPCRRYKMVVRNRDLPALAPDPSAEFINGSRPRPRQATLRN